MYIGSKKFWFEQLHVSNCFIKLKKDEIAQDIIYFEQNWSIV